MTFKEVYSEETGIKFKDNFDFILFLIMNILATPFIWLGCAIVWGVQGFVVSILVFILSFLLWKLYGKREGKLIFAPSFTFGKKKFGFKK